MLNCYFFPSYLAIMRSNGTRALIVSYLQGYGTSQFDDPHATISAAGAELIQAASGCRNYELLAACALSCAHWLSSADSLSLNPDAQPHGPLRAPPGADPKMQLQRTHMHQPTSCHHQTLICMLGLLQMFSR